MKKDQKDIFSQLTREELIQKLQAQAKELHLQGKLLTQTFQEYQVLKEKYTVLQAKMVGSTDGYDPKRSWVSKIAFVLKSEGRPLRSFELIVMLEQREPMLQHHHSKEKYFSAFLNSAVKHQRIVQYKLGGVRGYYHLLPEWLDEGGQPTKMYQDMML